MERNVQVLLAAKLLH